jgi:hypothetical protein
MVTRRADSFAMHLTRHWVAAWLAPCVASAALLLAGCGGGGGSGSGGGPGPVVRPTLATVSLSLDAISLQGDTSVDAVPSVDFQIKFNQSPTPVYYYAFSYKGTAIREMDYVFGGDIPPNTLEVSLYRPGQLGAGTYMDEIQLKVCVDVNCAQQYPGSPFRIPVTFNVTGSATPTTTFQAIGGILGGVAHTGDTTPPANSYRVDFYDLPLNGIYARWQTPSGPVVADVAFIQPNCDFNCTGPDTGTFTFALKPPNELASGTYTDTVTIEFCFDQACARPLPGSPLVLNFTYEILLTEGIEYTSRIVQLAATDIAWNSADQRLYAVVATGAGVNPNSLTQIDPTTGALGASLTLNGNPSRLAISDDGQYAYVSLPDQFAIQRVHLPDMTTDLMIPMGVDAQGNGLKAARMAVAPGAPTTIAVAFENHDNDAGGIAVFDNDVQRAQSIAPLDREDANSIAWGDTAATLYVARSAYQTSTYSMDTVDVTASGLGINTVHDVAPFQDGFSIYSGLFYAAGRFYETSGTVLDVATGTPLGVMDLSYPDHLDPTLIPDPAHGKVFALYYGGLYSTTYLAAFDQSTFKQVAWAQMDLGVDTSSHLIRWGTNGLAYSQGGFGIEIVSGPLVGP